MAPDAKRPAAGSSREENGKTQDEVLAKKDGVTQGKLGLQQWSDEAQPDQDAEGTGSTGTAARQAKVTKRQEEP